MITIRRLKKTYRYSAGITIFFMSISGVLLMANGQASQRMDPMLFMCFYALVNVYVWLLTYMYVPHIDNDSRSGRYDTAQAERERNNIMKEFYENELEDHNEIDQSFDTSMSAGDFTERTLLSGNDNKDLKQRGNSRSMKRAPKEKAKEKLWESIVNQAEKDADESSSDDDGTKI